MKAMNHADPLHGWLDRIHQGDALEVMSQMPDECVNVVVTSPPYNLLNSSGNGMRNNQQGKWRGPRAKALSQGYPEHSDDIPRSEYIDWQRQCLEEMLRILTNDGAIFYIHRGRMQKGVEESPRDILNGLFLRQEIIWAKPGGINHTPYAMTPTHESVFLIVKDPSSAGYRRREGSVDYGSVWAISRDTKADHPCPFPVELARRCIQMVTGPVALDPFVGSGTTAVAAVQEGRDYIGIDLNAKYCKSARKRVQLARLDDDLNPNADSDEEGWKDFQAHGFDTQWDASQGSQGSQSDASQGSQSDASQGSQSDASQGWMRVAVRWDHIDRAVYDRIAETQKATKLQAVPLNQQEIANELDCSPRTVNNAISKLKKEGALTVKYQRGPSLYSVSSEIPRWPVRISGGLGTLPQGSQSDASQGSQSDASQGSQSDASHTRVRDREPGLINQVNLREINPVPGPGVPARAREDAGARHVAPDAAVCPLHTQVHLQVVTTYRPLVAIMQATGDEIRYCYGSNGRCSWVHSRELGMVVAAGGRRLDALGIEAAYYDLRSDAQPAAGSNKDTSRTGYLDSYRRRHGRLPWEG